MRQCVSYWGITVYTSHRAMRYLLNFFTIQNKISLCRTRAYLRISADMQHQLYPRSEVNKGERLMIGKSWMGHSIDIAQQVCAINDIQEGEGCACLYHQIVIRPSVYALHLSENADCRTH
jgi:hypothetical protein